MILDAIRKRWPWIKQLFADGAYDRTQLTDKAAFLGFAIEVVRFRRSSIAVRTTGRSAALTRLLLRRDSRIEPDQQAIVNRHPPGDWPLWANIVAWRPTRLQDSRMRRRLCATACAATSSDQRSAGIAVCDILIRRLRN